MLKSIINSKIIMSIQPPKTLNVSKYFSAFNYFVIEQVHLKSILQGSQEKKAYMRSALNGKILQTPKNLVIR
jgi:hypothetical protein